MKWKNKQLVGFSVRSLEELMRVILLGINMVEIKLEKFASSGFPLYVYKKRHFYPITKNINLIKKICTDSGVSVQFHLPIENTLSIDIETGLNTGVLRHHNPYSERYLMFEEIYQKDGLGTILTVHPPLAKANSKIIHSEKRLIENSRIFYEKHDERRIRENHQTIIGLENQTDMKIDSGNLGYLPRHFKIILRNCRTFGLTVDTGHRRLARNFSISEFLATGLPFVNFHFHGNDGVINPNCWDDDQHLLPSPNNLSGGALAYANFMRFFRRHRAPIVLEISHLERYSDEELRMFLKNFFLELQ